MAILNALRIPSKRLILSYIFDWVVICGIAGVGGGFHYTTPHQRAFSLLDLSISFPHQLKETVPTWLLIVCGMVIPAAVIFLVCLIFVPGKAARQNTEKRFILRCKLWEWNVGWMGLGLSLAIAFMATEGMKNLFGKPRPDLLDRCKPDLGNFNNYVVGGFGSPISDRWQLVSHRICQQTSKDILDDGFKSFPSGHSSFSWAGLLYLSFFLCSKFAITIPFLPPRPFSNDQSYTALRIKRSVHGTFPNGHKNDSREDPHSSSRMTDGFGEHDPIVPIRNQAAAPPAWVIVLALVPIGLAVFISASRYTDYRHKGFDILFGSFIGIISSWYSFRMYHLPIQSGAGWAWGSRSRDRSFIIGVGEGNWSGPEGWRSKKSDHSTDRDVESEAAAINPTELTDFPSGQQLGDSTTAQGTRRQS